MHATGAVAANPTEGKMLDVGGAGISSIAVRVLVEPVEAMWALQLRGGERDAGKGFDVGGAGDVGEDDVGYARPWTSRRGRAWR